MSYQYDIFLSYKRPKPESKWVDETFYPKFVEYICEALNKDAVIFKDTDEIKTGQTWDLKIKSALIHSKIMVSVFSAAYFRSEWCKKEFAFMDYRQKQCGLSTIENPNGLIVPIKIFDGEHFPEYANRLQISDFNKFYRDSLHLTNSPVYIDFQDRLDIFVQDVALAYNNAPEWNEEWKQPEWISNAWKGIEKLNGLSDKTNPKL